MSKIRDAREEIQQPLEQGNVPIGGTARTDLPPLKPRRGLFVLFGALLVLLFAGMLAMYFATVYPNRYKPHSVEMDQTAESAGQK